jgi:hypothetical protein
VNIGLALVTGGAGIAISVGGTTSTVREVLRDKTAAELEMRGREKLAAMGVSPGTVNAFYATTGLSPTDKAVIVASLMSLAVPLTGRCSLPAPRRRKAMRKDSPTGARPN